MTRHHLTLMAAPGVILALSLTAAPAPGSPAPAPGNPAVASPDSKAAAANAPLAQRRVLTLDGARHVIASAVAEARKHNATGVFAVVDDGGNLMALERLDNTFPAGASISIGKARTAAIFRKPTRFFEEVIGKGRTAMAALPDFTPLQGGVPIMVDGQVVGAIGVSGASSAQQDEDFALVGAAALGAMPAAAAADPVTGREAGDVTHLGSAEVTTAFSRGMPLIENGQLKVHASRREKPGLAEVHMHETDVIYVLQGSATLVTGGSLTDPRDMGDGEVRGTSIASGDTRTIGAGDVIVVPKGTPHWFREIGDGPILYYVVKVLS